MLKASFRYQILSSTASPAIGAISGHRITHYQMDNAASIEVLRASNEISTENLSNAAAASDHPGVLQGLSEAISYSNITSVWSFESSGWYRSFGAPESYSEGLPIYIVGLKNERDLLNVQNNTGRESLYKKYFRFHFFHRSIFSNVDQLVSKNYH